VRRPAPFDGGAGWSRQPQNPAPDQPQDAGAQISALYMLTHLQGVIEVDDALEIAEHIEA
jgi:hypothetical protein